MGEVDTQRQELNVFRMELLGAEVRTVTSGSRTLKDAVNEAMREWVATVDTTHYCLGSVMGPHPFPYMVRQLQRVVGDEARGAVRRAARRRRARRRGGLHRRRLQRGRDLRRLRRHAGPAGRRGGGRRRRGHQRHSRASCTACTRACCRTRPGRSRRPSRSRPGWTTRAWAPSTPTWRPSGGPSTPWPTDDEVLDAFRLLSHTEGIIPALESAHAVAWVARSAGHRGAAGGVHRAGHAVGPRRQGRGPGARDLRARDRCLTSRRSSGPAASRAASC